MMPGIVYQLSSEEYMVAVAKALGIETTGLYSMNIYAEIGFPVTIEIKMQTFADQRLLKVTIPRIPTDED